MHAYIFHQAIRLANAASDYMNHNTSANLDSSSDLDTSIANRDIYPGEELFENYYAYGTGPKWWLEMVIEENLSCIHLLNFFRTSKSSWVKYCMRNIMGNGTYGRKYAPFVDKIQAKHLVRSLNTSVKIPATYATFNEKNSTKKILKDVWKTLPSKKIVVKPNHFSGGCFTRN